MVRLSLGAANDSQCMHCQALRLSSLLLVPWFRRSSFFASLLPANLGIKQTGSTPIYADNETCIHWSEGSVRGSDRAKHIDLRKHFVHDARQQGVLQLIKTDSKLNSADILTKPFKDTMLFERHRKHIMGY